MFLLDTNILVQYCRDSVVSRRIEADYHVLTQYEAPLVSIVTVGEIQVFAREKQWGYEKTRRMNELLTYFTVIPLPFANTVERYVELMEFSRRAGRVLSNNDIWIAASASSTGATLLTTDRDFEVFPPALLAHAWVNPAL